MNTRRTSRRNFLKTGLCTAAVLWSNVLVGGCGSRVVAPLRGLQAADANGVRLPPGFRSRIVARSGEKPAAASDYVWHAGPDGGACFAAEGGGWIYVSNSEMPNGQGGAGALRFDAGGTVVDAWSMLQGTNRNCAGGATPWGAWLSCEEVECGLVWETDPFGNRAAVPRPALGVFNHEAVAVDLQNGQLYLTEDRPDGALYRFTPDALQNLASGLLEVAKINGDRLEWSALPDPSAAMTPTRRQLDSAAFDGGEGIVYHDGFVYFTTKGDNRVWSLDTATQEIAVLYDDDSAVTPVLTGVDNITVDAGGGLYVAEDGGDLQVVVLSVAGDVFPLIQLEGHDSSEIAGVAFDPSGSRLYFSSQRGTQGHMDAGMTFEITGPFMRL